VVRAVCARAALPGATPGGAASGWHGGLGRQGTAALACHQSGHAR